MAERTFNAGGFYAYLKEGKLMGSRSKKTGKLYVPPRTMCPDTFSTEMEWTEVSGNGKLVAFTVIIVAPTHMIEAGYGRDNPFCAGIVQLDEGPGVSAQIFGVDVKKPESIKIGMPLKMKLIERGQGPEGAKTYLGFEPA
jgi:uncharacterized OB-fold protein